MFGAPIFLAVRPLGVVVAISISNMVCFTKCASIRRRGLEEGYGYEET